MRRGLLAAVLVVAGLVLLGSLTPVRAPATGTVSLGPDQGVVATDYVASAGTALAALPGGDPAPRWALVSLRGGLTPDAAAPLVGDLRVSRVLLHVAADRVQTAVVQVDTAGQGAPAGFLAEAQASAAALEAAVASAPGRAGRVAAASAAQLRRGCACVVGLVVRGDPAALAALAGRGPVRAVDVAPAGTSWGSLAVRPLLPEQTGVVGPGPDDGPVPG